MEDLQSLMACLDDISSKIGDGMYLDMANKLKNIHNKLNGNKPFHQDSFYYSDDDSELDSNSDDDSDSDDEQAVRNEFAKAGLELPAALRPDPPFRPVRSSVQRVTIQPVKTRNKATVHPINDETK